MKPTIIAEVKTRSPYGFRSPYTWQYLFDVASVVGDWISIHTDERWGGSWDQLKKARSLTAKPILAKGIHETDAEIQRAFELGADKVLIVGRWSGSFSPKSLFYEPYRLPALKQWEGYVSNAVWNQRELIGGGWKTTETFEMARKVFPGFLCQASGIGFVSDIHPEADAVLVGSRLLDFAHSTQNHTPSPALAHVLSLQPRDQEEDRAWRISTSPGTELGGWE